MPEPWILGLDIGTDSIGWAAFAWPDDENAYRLLGGGVRLFDSGRDPKEHTSNQRDRGMFRRARRQPRAWRWRKEQLAKTLVAGGLNHPTEAELQTALPLRAQALDRALTGGELWAVLFHMAKHRGFRSNRIERKAAEAAKGKPKADDEAGFWLNAEKQLRARMAEENAPTVGALLAGDMAAGRPTRMRYNLDDGVFAPTRALVAEEFDTIRAAQAPHFPELDWPRVAALVLDQRPLRTKEEGPCEFLEGERRAPRALPSIQAFIVRQTLANLRVKRPYPDEPRPLTEDEFAAGLEALTEVRVLDWPKLRKAMDLKRGAKFTIEEKQGGKSASRKAEGNHTNALLSPIPGWEDWTTEERDAAFTTLWEARRDRPELMASIAALGVTDREEAETLADAIQFELPTGRANLSAKAARLITAELVAGVRTDEAILKALGVHHSHRPRAERLDRLPYYAEALPDVGLGGSHDKADLLPPDHKEVQAGLERFYGRVMNISVHIALNEVRKVVNALLHRHGPNLIRVTLETTRELKAGAEERKKLVYEQADRERENAAIDTELRKQGQWAANARERRTRYRLAKRQRFQCPYTFHRIEMSALLTETYDIDHVIPLSRGGRDSLSNKVLCEAGANKGKGKRTPWEAFHDQGTWEQEKDRWLADLDRDVRIDLDWRFSEQAGEKATRMAAGQDDSEEGFLNRQLTDTGYIARVAKRYLELVTVEPSGVVCTPGRLTGLLRKHWDLFPGPAPRDLLPAPREALEDPEAAKRFLDGLEPAHVQKAVKGLVNDTLTALGRTEVKDAELHDALRVALYGLPGGGKNRADHRHHYIDAAVIAMTTRSVVQRVNTANAQRRISEDDDRTNVPEPYPGFRAQVIRQWEHVWPSIRPAHREGGALHAATVFGVRRRPEGTTLVQRKSVRALFLDPNGKPLPAEKVEKVLASFASDRMRERFQALLDQRRATHPEEKLAESCMAVARHTSFGPRGMTGNTVLAGSVAEEGDSGLITPFRGNAKAAVRTQGNAVYEVWEVPGKSSGTVKWEARVRTRFDMISTEAASANPAKEKNGGRLVMCLRRGDLVLLPEAQDDKLFIVKKMVVDGRLYLWPARIGTGRANAIFAQLSHPTVNLTGDQGYCLNSGEILRKLNVTRFSISVLGRLRRD
jgi:CRISPR-associated endonuclease Csn1